LHLGSFLFGFCSFSLHLLLVYFRFCYCLLSHCLWVFYLLRFLCTFLCLSLLFSALPFLSFSASSTFWVVLSFGSGVHCWNRFLLRSLRSLCVSPFLSFSLCLRIYLPHSAWVILDEFSSFLAPPLSLLDFLYFHLLPHCYTTTFVFLLSLPLFSHTFLLSFSPLFLSFFSRSGFTLSLPYLSHHLSYTLALSFSGSLYIFCGFHFLVLDFIIYSSPAGFHYWTIYAGSLLHLCTFFLSLCTAACSFSFSFSCFTLSFLPALEREILLHRVPLGGLEFLTWSAPAILDGRNHCYHSGCWVSHLLPALGGIFCLESLDHLGLLCFLGGVPHCCLHC